MTKKELAKLDSQRVRRDAALFSLFKKYANEDAGLLYSTGKLPGGCFGCQFNSMFNRWRKLYTNSPDHSPANYTTMSKTKTYKLKNEATKYYFGGKVLSNKSTDGEWLRWINKPEDKEEVKRRKDIFETLPGKAKESKPKAAAKTVDPKTVDPKEGESGEKSDNTEATEGE